MGCRRRHQRAPAVRTSETAHCDRHSDGNHQGLSLVLKLVSKMFIARSTMAESVIRSPHEPKRPSCTAQAAPPVSGLITRFPALPPARLLSIRISIHSQTDSERVGRLEKAKARLSLAISKFSRPLFVTQTLNSFIIMRMTTGLQTPRSTGLNARRR